MRQRLLEATVECLVERGWSGTSTTLVSERAGVSRGAQLHHFPTKGDLVLPELASSYLDRSWRRPGMILEGGPVIAAFESVGWHWGGYWRSLKDRHHFSANDR